MLSPPAASDSSASPGAEQSYRLRANCQRLGAAPRRSEEHG